MEDTKFSDLDPVTAVASPDFVAVVQGGVSKRADVSLFGGPFLSTDVGRVDHGSGDDSTAVLGDMTKPFQTIEAALLATAHVLWLTGEFHGTEDLVIDGATPTIIGESSLLIIAPLEI